MLIKKLVFYYLLALLSLIGVHSTKFSAKKLPATFSRPSIAKVAASSFTAAALLLGANGAVAVSGGGKDYASKDLKGMSFAGTKNDGKDFTQSDGTGVDFSRASLRGTRFYKGILKDAVFTSADLSGTSFEDTQMTDAILDDAIMEGSYLSDTFPDVKSMKGADLTDALMPEKTKDILCKRNDLDTANSKTGVVTRESLLCD